MACGGCQARANGLRAASVFSRSRQNSLFPELISLFLKMLSLLIFVGNFTKEYCSAAVSCSEMRSWGSEIAKFPVKFPVSREFAWRQVRSALRRQPGSCSYNLKHFLIFRRFHSERPHLSHSERLLPFGSPVRARGVCGSPTASALQFASHILRSFPGPMGRKGAALAFGEFRLFKFGHAAVSAGVQGEFLRVGRFLSSSAARSFACPRTSRAWNRDRSPLSTSRKIIGTPRRVSLASTLSASS